MSGPPIDPDIVRRCLHANNQSIEDLLAIANGLTQMVAELDGRYAMLEATVRGDEPQEWADRVPDDPALD